MKPALAFRQPHYPKNWQDLPSGDTILSAIDERLQPWWESFFGYHLLKIGALSHSINTSNSPIKHKITCCLNKNTIKADHNDVNNQDTYIVGELDDLPILEHSVDVCLLSHVLEFSLDPHHVIREANRVLIPNGYFIITGFNPFSLAGLNRIIPYRKKQTPWNEHFFSPTRVKDWLHLMGFEILSDERFLQSSLIGKTSKHSVDSYWQRSWQKIANRYFTSLGSVYIIIAKKRVLPLTPIKPKWKINTEFTPVKVPTMNVNSSNKTET